MSKALHGHKKGQLPWPRCEYFFYTSTGARQCRWEAIFVCEDLNTMLDTKLACPGHLPDIVQSICDAICECEGSEHLVLVRLLRTGGVGWPT